MKKAENKKAEPENLISLWFGRVQQSARLMCGVPDYDTYLAHMQAKHPDKAAMNYEEFFLNRQDARFGASNTRCCC